MDCFKENITYDLYYNQIRYHRSFMYNRDKLRKVRSFMQMRCLMYKVLVTKFNYCGTRTAVTRVE